MNIKYAPTNKVAFSFGFMSKTSPTANDFYLQKYKDIIKEYYQIEYEDKILGYATKEGCKNYISLRSRG